MFLWQWSSLHLGLRIQKRSPEKLGKISPVMFKLHVMRGWAFYHQLGKDSIFEQQEARFSPYFIRDISVRLRYQNLEFLLFRKFPSEIKHVWWPHLWFNNTKTTSHVGRVPSPLSPHIILRASLTVPWLAMGQSIRPNRMMTPTNIFKGTTYIYLASRLFHR